MLNLVLYVIILNLSAYQERQYLEQVPAFGACEK